MTSVTRRNPDTGRFEPTTEQEIAREYIRENTRLLKFFVG